MSGDKDSDVRPTAKVEVDYTPGDRWRMSLVNWPRWLVGPLSAAFAFLFVSLLFRVSRGDTIVESMRDLPFGLAMILAGTFLAIRIGVDLVPIALEHLRSGKREAELPVTFGLEDNGLSIFSERASTTLGWAMFASVRVTPDHLFYFLSRRSVLMVPRRCFADDRQFEQWRAFSEARFAESREVR